MKKFILEMAERCAECRFYCLSSLLHDIQAQCHVDLGVTWRYDEMGLFNIAGVGYPDKDTGVRVVPKKVNAAYQAMVLLKLAKLQQAAAQ